MTVFRSDVFDPDVFDTIDIPAGKWVSQTGSDANPGTFSQPYATIQYGWSQLGTGETLWVKDDLTPTSFSSTSTGSILTASGSSGNPKQLRGWPEGTRRIIDYSNTILDTWGGTGLRVTGAWAILRDLHIRNVDATGRTAPYVDGVNWRGANGQMINCEVSLVKGRGLTIGENGAATNLLVQNCDFHDCFDPASSPPYNDADGIQLFGSQTGVVIEKCRIWRCADDGIDMFFQTSPVTIRENWIWAIGYREDGTTTGGDGTGIKAGSASNGANHTIEKNLVFDCRVFGISANDSPTAHTWSRNTAIDCGYEATRNGVAISLQGNAKYGGSNALSGSAVVRNRNSFDNPPNITESPSWFISLSRTGVDGARQSNGDLPDLDFAKPAPGSDLTGNGPGGTTIGAYDGAGGVDHVGAASLSASGSISAAAQRQAVGAASLVAAGTIVAAASRAAVGAVALAGTGTVTPSGVRVAVGATALAGSGAVQAGAVRAAVGATALAAAGTVTPSGVRVAVGATALAGSGSLQAGAVRAAVAAASHVGAGTISASGVKALVAVVEVAGAGTITADGVVSAGPVDHVGAAQLSGAGGVAAVAVRVALGAAAFSGVGAATFAGVRVALGAASHSGGGSMQAAAVRIAVGGVTLAAGGSMVGSGVRAGLGAAALLATGLMGADGRVVLPNPGRAALPGESRNDALAVDSSRGVRVMRGPNDARLIKG